MQVSLALHVLGTGTGASSTYAGICSTAFVLLADGEPVAMIDAGGGATLACLNAFGKLPDNLVVTHNHTDHAGELPVILRVESQRNRRLNVFAEHEVANRLRTHRLAEHAGLFTPDDLAGWHMPQAGERIPFALDLSIEFHQGRHSERSCGFLLYRNNAAVLAYTGDSEAAPALYAALQAAPVRIFDARPAPAEWHATFDEVVPYLTARDHIVGHGLAREHAPHELPLLFAGDRVILD